LTTNLLRKRKKKKKKKRKRSGGRKGVGRQRHRYALGHHILTRRLHSRKKNEKKKKRGEKINHEPVSLAGLNDMGPSSSSTSYLSLRREGRKKKERGRRKVGGGERKTRGTRKRKKARRCVTRSTRRPRGRGVFCGIPKKEKDNKKTKGSAPWRPFPGDVFNSGTSRPEKKEGRERGEGRTKVLVRDLHPLQLPVVTLQFLEGKGEKKK